MEKKATIDVVHLPTQEQWDRVTKAEKIVWFTVDPWSVFGYQSCIRLDTQTFSNLEHYHSQGYNILTFEQWQVRKTTPTP